MNKYMKRSLTLGLLLLGLGITGRAHAASTDTITISVTPNATFGVTISSPYASGYNFGTVNLNFTTQSTLAITLTNTGTIYEYFGISVSNTSGGWAASSVLPSTDTFRLSGALQAAQPAVASANFSALGTMAPAAAAALYGQASTKTSPTAGNNTQNLWLKMEMPFTLNTGGSGAQTMVVSVTGQAS